MKKMKSVSLLGILGLMACQGNDRITEVRTMERAAELKVESDLAITMEKDLQTRQKFYSGVVGIYEGNAISESGSMYKIRVKIVSSLPEFYPARTRMREEVAADINNLFLNAQVLLWNPDSKVGAVGCRATGIRPSLTAGVIEIASSDCPNFYTIRLGSQNLNGARVQDTNQIDSEGVSRAMLDGRIVKAPSIFGEIQPTASHEKLSFSADRILEGK